MALWVCGGEAGCGTKYAVGLFRCPRCHNTEFYEDGDPMAKITRHGGASDHTVPAPEAEAEPLDITEHMAGPAQLVPVPEEEGGEESSPGSSSSASAETQQPNSAPSEPQPPSPAPTTGSRSRKGRTGSRSASGTGGGREAGTSETGSADE